MRYIELKCHMTPLLGRFYIKKWRSEPPTPQLLMPSYYVIFDKAVNTCLMFFSNLSDGQNWIYLFIFSHHPYSTWNTYVCTMVRCLLRFITYSLLQAAWPTNKSKIIPREHNIGIKCSLCVIPDYNLPPCQISSKSVQYFLSQFVTIIQIFPFFLISLNCT